MARELWILRSYLVFIPTPAGQAWLKPCPGTAMLRPAPLGWAGAAPCRQHQRALRHQHSAALVRDSRWDAWWHCRPWASLSAWHGTNNALSTPSSIEEGVILLVRTRPGGTTSLLAQVNNSHLRGEGASLGAIDVLLLKGMVSVALLSHHTGFLSSWGNKHYSKSPLLKQLRLSLLIHPTENCHDFVNEHLHLPHSKSGRMAHFQRPAFPQMLIRKQLKCTANGLKHERGERATQLCRHFPESRRKPSLRFKGHSWLECERSTCPASSTALSVMGDLN